MMYTKFHLLLLITFTLCIPTFSQSAQLDSLLLEINKNRGEEKLKAILAASSGLRDNTELLLLSDLLEEEAKEQSNLKFLAYSYKNKAFHYLSLLNHDSIQHYITLSEKIFTEINDQQGIQDLDFIFIVWYMAQENNDLVIYKVQKLLDNVDKQDIRTISSLYNTMGLAYLFSSKPEEAIKTLKKGLEIMRQGESQEEGIKTNIYSLLSESYRATKEYDKALAYCDSMKINIETNMVNLVPSRISKWKLYTACAYASVYIEQNQLQKARVKLIEAESYLTAEMHTTSKDRLNKVEAEYYFKNEEYTLALHHLDLSIGDTKNKLPSEYAKLLIFRSKILAKLGQASEAFELRDYAAQYLDSLSHRNMNMQLAEIRASYQLEEWKMKIEKDRIQLQSKQRIIMVLSILAGLLVAFIILIRRNSLLQNKKNRILIEQLKNGKPKRIEKGVDNDLSPEKKLFDTIDEYVQTTQCFKDPNINRDSLSASLATNRQYLTDAIKRETGMTLNEYINNYRLEYCCEQFLNNESESIKNIFVEAGFVSDATFYRQFVSKYGMAPQKFRELSKEIDSPKTE